MRTEVGQEVPESTTVDTFEADDVVPVAEPIEPADREELLHQPQARFVDGPGPAEPEVLEARPRDARPRPAAVSSRSHGPNDDRRTIWSVLDAGHADQLELQPEARELRVRLGLGGGSDQPLQLGLPARDGPCLRRACTPSAGRQPTGLAEVPVVARDLVRKEQRDAVLAVSGDRTRAARPEPRQRAGERPPESNGHGVGLWVAPLHRPMDFEPARLPSRPEDGAVLGVVQSSAEGPGVDQSPQRGFVSAGEHSCILLRPPVACAR